MATPTAAEILAQCVEVYAACASYEDEGEVTTHRIGDSQSRDGHVTKDRFRTAFVRPTLYRLESATVGRSPESELDRSVLWQDERGAYSWNGAERRTLSMDVALDLLDHFGTTRSARLLGLGGRKVVTRFDPATTQVTHDQFESSDCYVIDDISGGYSRRTWIECSTHFLRRMDHRREFSAEAYAQQIQLLRSHVDLLDAERRQMMDRVIENAMKEEPRGFVLESTTVWHPRMNHAIDPKVFEFEPPG